MRPNLSITYALAAALLFTAGRPSNSQTPDAVQSIPQVAPLTNFNPSPSPKASEQAPQGYLDPNFAPNRDSDVADKPHAGIPLQSGDSTVKPEPQPQQSYATPQWYKNSPQAYDHTQHHAPRVFHVRPQVSHKSDPPPASVISSRPDTHQEIAEAPQSESQPEPQQYEPEQTQPSYGGPAPQYAPTPQYQYTPQPAPRYYTPQPAPQYEPQQPQQSYGNQDDDQPRYDQPPYNQPNYAQPNYDQPQPGYTQQPLSADQLEQLAAPIALYPDSLLAQILTAATYPAQVSAADQWLHSMGNADPGQIAAGANAQTSWDPSVKALTAFPQALDMLAGNLQWTTSLGNAYYNQPQDVLQTVQVLRQRAEQAGNLETTPQQQVIQEPGYIAVQPQDPQTVYVPTYNPWAVYGQPIAPCPGFALFDTFGSVVESGVQFGIGFGIAPFLQMPFGLMAWGLDWLGGAILFHDGAYWTHSHEVRDWGFAHGGRRWDGGGRGWQNGGNQMARFGNYNHEPLSVHGGGANGGFGHVSGGPSRPFAGGNERAFGGRPPENRVGNGFGRAFPGGNPTQPQRPGEQAFGRTPYTGGRPEPVGPRGFNGNSYGGRPGYGYGGPMQPYGGHPGMAYARPAEPFGGRPSPYTGGQGFRPATPGGVYGREPYSGQPSRSFGSNGFANQPRFSAPRSPEPRFSQPSSGGGHWFGGGHSAPSYGGSHAFNGGGFSSHSFGGGGGFSSHSFGGGGHSFGGGGHSFGGGHSGGGGYSSGGHSGGGHHR